MIGKIVPRCIDTYAAVRQTAVDILKRVLEISCIYETLTIAENDEWYYLKITIPLQIVLISITSNFCDYLLGIRNWAIFEKILLPTMPFNFIISLKIFQKLFRKDYQLSNMCNFGKSEKKTNLCMK